MVLVLLFLGTVGLQINFFMEDCYQSEKDGNYYVLFGISFIVGPSPPFSRSILKKKIDQIVPESLLTRA